MDSSKIAVKFFAKHAAVESQAFVLLFHQWIQTHALADHLLIDVADYRHVQNGPGTVLVAHEGNFSSDEAGGRLGLLYARKQPIEGSLADRLRVVFKSALHAMELIEAAPEFAGKIQFRTDNPIMRINDRLLAPNSAATFAEVRPALEAFLAGLYAGPVKLSHEPNPELVFEVQINATTSPTAAELSSGLVGAVR